MEKNADEEKQEKFIINHKNNHSLHENGAVVFLFLFYS